MKVLYICNRGEIGGATKAILNTIKELKKNKIEPIVITPNKNSYVQKECDQMNVECHYIKYYEIGYAFNDFDFKKFIKLLIMPFLWLLNIIVNNNSISKINKVINFDEIDFIHSNTNRDNFGVMLSQKYRKRHIMHLREFDTDFFNLKYLKKDIYKYFDENTTVFIAVSNAIKDYYIKKGIDKNKIVVVYDGIDDKNIKFKKDYSYKEKIKILMLSNIAENKGQIQLIEAINLMNNEIKSKIFVDFYGTGSNTYIEKLKKVIKNYNLENQFNFLGYSNNVYDIVKNYDIGITASKIEGFGMVTVEYMLSGLPVIVSDTGANIEIIRNNYNGLVYKYGDCNDLKSKICSLVNDKNKSEKLAIQAMNDANEKYTIGRNCIELEKIYLNLKS